MKDLSSTSDTRNIAGVLRYVATLVGQLLRQPVLDALITSLVFGAIPMILTALYSLIRTCFHWHRHSTYWLRRSAEHSASSQSRGQPGVPVTVTDELVPATHLNNLLNR